MQPKPSCNTPEFGCDVYQDTTSTNQIMFIYYDMACMAFVFHSIPLQIFDTCCFTHFENESRSPLIVKYPSFDKGNTGIVFSFDSAINLGTLEESPIVIIDDISFYKDPTSAIIGSFMLILR